MRGRIKGITVGLHVKKEKGKDAFNQPVYESDLVQVANVLVAPTSADDAATTLNLYGKKAVYTLAIPKEDDHVWEDTEVEFFGRTWKTCGYPMEGIEENIPLNWNKKVMVEAYG